MNKFMRLFALLLVVAAIVLIVFAVKLGSHKAPTPAPRQASTTQARAGTPAPATYAVVTAASTLEPGVAIAANQLDVEKLAQPVTGSYASVDQVAGAIPAISVAKGSVLTKSMLIDDLSLKLKPGERAVAIPVTGVTGIANRIHPGDYVDLFFSLQTRADNGSGKTHSQARLLLPRLRVLAFGSRDLPASTPAPAASSAKGKARAENQRAAPARTAVLAVPLDKVNRLLLVLAQSQGKLTLALRNPADPGMPDPSLFPQPGPVLVAKASARKAGDDAAADAYSNPDSADNKAYAGIALHGLAQGGTSHHSRRQRHVPRVHRVDIIRGTQRSHITLPNH